MEEIDGGFQLHVLGLVLGHIGGRTAAFIAAALSPARVNSGEIVDPVAKAARVIVPDYQLYLAIGREGQTTAFVPNVTGAPGDGRISLTSALQRELSRNGVPLASASAFDLGVYLVVVGATMTMLLAIARLSMPAFLPAPPE